MGNYFDSGTFNDGIMGNYNNGVDAMTAGGMAGFIVAIIVTVIFIAISISILFSAACYVLNAIALMKMAKQRGLKNPWIAWIPVVRDYTLGQIADDINSKYGITTKKRIAMVWLNASLFVLNIVTLIASMAWNISLISELVDHNRVGSSIRGIEPDILGGTIAILIVSLAVIVLAIILLVIKFQAYNKIFKEYDPGNSTVYTVTTVISYFFITFILPSIFLLVISKKTPQHQLHEAERPAQNSSV